MALISEEYRLEQSEMHKRYPQYGSASVQFAPYVEKIILEWGVKEVLDYGAGKGRLGLTLLSSMGDRCPSIRNYEPARLGWDTIPDPAELVTCIDVLEHVEPNCITEVLDDLKRCVKTLGIFTIHTGPAVKTLSDGRNAHLIQKQFDWWEPMISARFTIKNIDLIENGIILLLEPRKNEI